MKIKNFMTGIFLIMLSVSNFSNASDVFPVINQFNVINNNVKNFAIANNSLNDIFYHGGEILGTISPVEVFVIFYGTWSEKQMDVVSEFLENISGTPRFRVNTTYTDAKGRPVKNEIKFNRKLNTRVLNKYKPSKTEPYDKFLNKYDIPNIANSSLKTSKDLFGKPYNGPFKFNSNAAYMVLTSGDVDIEGFTEEFCGFHDYMTIKVNNKKQYLKYGLAGQADKNPAKCSTQPNVSLNGISASNDSMIKTMLHEIEEIVSDGTFKGYYDKDGHENADKCAWITTNPFVLPDGGKYNFITKNYKYLLDDQWANANGGYCSPGI